MNYIYMTAEGESVWAACTVTVTVAGKRVAMSLDVAGKIWLD